MKKMMMVLLSGIALLFFTACGGGSSGDGGNTPAPVTVNVLGDWNYAVSTQNSVCDGLLAQGLEIIDDLNGDTSKIGDITIQGEGFALDQNQNCYITSVDKTSSLASGANSVMTESEFLQLGKDLNQGDHTISSIRIDSFTASKIITVVEHTNGVIITSLLTR